MRPEAQQKGVASYRIAARLSRESAVSRLFRGRKEIRDEVDDAKALLRKPKLLPCEAKYCAATRIVVSMVARSDSRARV